MGPSDGKPSTNCFCKWEKQFVSCTTVDEFPLQVSKCSSLVADIRSEEHYRYTYSFTWGTGLFLVALLATSELAYVLVYHMVFAVGSCNE